MVIPALAAANAAALLVECALNILVSIPALSNRDLNHLARVDEHTGLCGLTTARNKWFAPHFHLCGKALSFAHMPAKSVVGRVCRCYEKLGRKNSALGFPCLDCFARPAS